jgi:hypothetical protein
MRAPYSPRSNQLGDEGLEPIAPITGATAISEKRGTKSGTPANSRTLRPLETGTTMGPVFDGISWDQLSPDDQAALLALARQQLSAGRTLTACDS